MSTRGDISGIDEVCSGMGYYGIFRLGITPSARLITLGNEIAAFSCDGLAIFGLHII